MFKVHFLFFFSVCTAHQYHIMLHRISLDNVQSEKGTEEAKSCLYESRPPFSTEHGVGTQSSTSSSLSNKTFCTDLSITSMIYQYVNTITLTSHSFSQTEHSAQTVIVTCRPKPLSTQGWFVVSPF